MTKYCVDNQGAYIGGFDGAEPPAGAIEVPAAPSSATDTWDGTAWVAQVIVPQSVTRRQALQALLLAGLLDDVQPAIDAIADPMERRMAQIEWDDSLDFVRNRPLLIQIGATLGLDSAALDQLFITAASL